ncbi:hypothetical protein EYF80_050003 [Liparis tanakae]|uniref:Uncharacterized protein n=1 Tax=Liparis tanakae TaxID=230148 RepID=A0A4Z2FHP0_9TELE|nr:hypothetical protein EYF80_050003 [Liparis tanakae]
MAGFGKVSTDVWGDDLSGVAECRLLSSRWRGKASTGGEDETNHRNVYRLGSASVNRGGRTPHGMSRSIAIPRGGEPVFFDLL